MFGEVLRSFAARSPSHLFWEVGAFTNLRLLAIVVGSVVVQLVIHHLPFMQRLFQIGALSLAGCVLSLTLGFIPVTVVELSKLVRRW